MPCKEHHPLASAYSLSVFVQCLSDFVACAAFPTCINWIPSCDNGSRPAAKRWAQATITLSTSSVAAPSVIMTNCPLASMAPRTLRGLGAVVLCPVITWLCAVCSIASKYSSNKSANRSPVGVAPNGRTSSNTRYTCAGSRQ